MTLTTLRPSSAPDFPGALDDAARAALFTDARTANAFSEQAVTDEDLTAVWDLAKWAPTQANFQPLRVLFVQSEEGRATLVEAMSDGNKAKTLSAPAVAVLAYDKHFHDHIPAVMPPLAAMKDMFEDDLELRNKTASFNAALQAGYFVLAVRSLGLAAGPMGGFDSAAVDAAFLGEDRWQSFLVVNIGHPTEGSFRDRMPRLEHGDTIRFA